MEKTVKVPVELIYDMNRKIEEIKRKLEEIEEIILPTEEISEEERKEIEKLKEGSLHGEYVEWEKIKEELLG